MKRPGDPRRPRVFIGLTEVAGYYSKLAEGLVEQGCSVTLVFLMDPFAYERANASFVSPPLTIKRLVARSSQSAGLMSRSVGLIARLLLLIWSLLRCDLFVFASGGTFFRGLDLWVLRILGKRTLAVFNGTDARAPYLSGIEWLAEPGLDLDGIRGRTRRTAAHVRRTERGVDAVIGHPAYCQLQRRPFYSYLAVGVPVPRAPDHDLRTEGPPVVLHAPTRPRQKGTAQIEAALEQLRQEGHAFEYRKLVGVPNEEVVAALLSSELVIDEVHGDTLLGGLGVEGAAAGCAVIVAGYAGDVIESTHTCPLPPIRLIDPDELLDEVRRNLAEPERRHQAGAALRSFVEANWRPVDVAGRVLAIFDGTAEGSWSIDPMDVIYTDGWGVSRTELHAGLHAYLERFGEAALYVDHHPRLRSALLERARRAHRSR